MGIPTWKEVVEHDKTSKLFFGTINGFSPAFRIVSSSFGVGFSRLMSTAALLAHICLILILILIVVSVTVHVACISIAITLKLVSCRVKKSLFTWWFIRTITPSMIIKDVSCVICNELGLE